MDPIQYGAVLGPLYQKISLREDPGVVTTYIPELARVPAEKFGVYLKPLGGAGVGFGDGSERFSIQSISKVLTLALAFEEMGDSLWDFVGVEPSGSSFNSLWQLEYESGRPRNPLINSGALIVCDQLVRLYDDPIEKLISFITEISGLPEVVINEEVARSEMSTGYRNHAMIQLMKSCGTIQGPVEKVLDLYYHQCSISMSCEELANTFLIFTNHGCIPGTDVQRLGRSKVKRIHAIMQTCGFYDEAGEFAFRVGLPGKSGVGGGIVAIHPGHFSAAVWSPRLNPKGNSVKGMQLLEELTTATGLSIF